MKLSPGQLIEGRYRVDGILGRGGFSTVYEGIEIGSGRGVAIKVLELTGLEDRARFERGVESASRLRNAHTVKTLSHGTLEDEQPYVVLERVDGKDLALLLHERGRLSSEVAEHILRQVLHSLREAHQHGVIHRDLKPDNIRVFESGSDPYVAKVLDFGLARRWDASRPQLTATGEVLGTPRYMAPEQILGENLSPACDIYSLGLVLFEMLAGPDALQGNSWMDQLDRMTTGYLFAAPGVSDASHLHEVIARMTMRDPADRFQSASAVIAALDGPAVRVRPRTATRVGAKVVGAAAILVVSVAAVVMLTSRTDDARLVPQPRDVTTLIAQPPVPLDGAVPDSTTGHAALGPDLASNGCGREPAFQGRRGRLGRGSDSWLTFIPNSYSPARGHAVLLLLYQENEPPEVLLTATEFEQLAEENGFIVLAPMDADGDSATGSWHNDPARDLRWLEFVIESTADELCIDRDRIYVVGQGNAGRAVENIACAGWAAALATNSFRRREIGTSCPDRPIPHLMLSPRHSKTAPFDGGRSDECFSGEKASVADMEKWWKKQNGCKGSRTQAGNYNESQCWRWACEEPFVSCHLDGGHGWPGTPRRGLINVLADCDGQPADFPTTDYVWSFFQNVEAARSKE